MKKAISKPLSVAALIFSVFPAVSYLLSIFKVTLSGGMQTALAGANIVCVLLGLGLSIVCVKNSESRNAINIISTVISTLWSLMITGFLALALFLSAAS